MLSFDVLVQRGSFTLEAAATFSAPWTVLFGPSGSGKTTLLRLLAGLDKPSFARGSRQAVRIIFNQQRLTDTKTGAWLPAGDRKTTLVMQAPALFPHLSVEANVWYGVRRKAEFEQEQRAWIAEVVAIAGAGELMQTPVRRLSGGEAQRVALARALAPRPKLLLLDEPFSALDGAASDALLDRLQAWATRHGTQVVMATHDVSDALATNAEVALLDAGRLVALGAANRVLHAERQRLIARLSDEPTTESVR